MDEYCEPMAQNVLHITDSNFETEVMASKEPFLLDFWATWCGPCLAIAPHVEAIANEHLGKLRVGKLDVDQNNQTATKFGIRSIPTLILFKNGQPVDQVIGGVSKSTLEAMVKKHV